MGKQSKYTFYRKKLLNKMNTLKKEGIELDLNVDTILTEKQLRKTGAKGKDITRQTRQLKYLLKNINEMRAYSNITGEIDTVASLINNKNKNYNNYTNKNANFTRVVIKTYRQQIRRFPPKVSHIVLQALDEAIAKSGEDNVALSLETRAESLSDFLNKSAMYGDSIAAIVAYCQAMFGDLPGVSEHYLETIDALEEEESYEG